MNKKDRVLFDDIHTAVDATHHAAVDVYLDAVNQLGDDHTITKRLSALKSATRLVQFRTHKLLDTMTGV